MSIEVPIDELLADLERWGPGYLLTVSEGDRTHVIALRPIATAGGTALRFDAGGGRACRNAAVRPSVTVLFPPTSDSNGMSLLVDGTATVSGDLVDVVPSRAVLHRAAP